MNSTTLVNTCINKSVYARVVWAQWYHTDSILADSFSEWKCEGTMDSCRSGGGLPIDCGVFTPLLCLVIEVTVVSDKLLEGLKC